MKTLSFIFLFTIISFAGFSQHLSLKVKIEGIEESKGTIYLSLHDNADSFPSDNNKAIRTGQIENFNSVAEITFKDLKEGEYAVSVFQDLNGNKELDTNFVGFPKEPVGASNMTSLGRPKFSKCKFKLSEDKTITVRYMN